jgi:putative ABC transport system permease protein
MNPVSIIWHRLRSLGKSSAMKREIDEELRFHLDQRTTENIAAGMSPEQAARDARKRFGNFQSVREECRARRGASFGAETLQDIRFGLRMLRRNPGLTTVVVLTLALGIGATTGIFTLLNTAILRPLPYLQPGRLMTIRNSYPELNLPATAISPFIYYRCRDLCTSFESIAAVDDGWPIATGKSGPEQVHMVKATANFLPLLGASPAIGRNFTAEEDRFGAGHVVILSDGFWRRRFGGEPKILGQTMVLDGTSFEIIGVLPPGFNQSEPSDLLAPLALSPAEQQDHGDHLRAFGRLTPGVTVTQAQLELDNLAKPIRDENHFLTEKKWRILAIPLQEFLTGQIRPMLTLLFSAVAVIMLIASVNVATLLLASGISREKEMAIRTSLGAGRRRLIRQLLVEGLVVSALGAVVGLLLAKGLVTWIAGLIPWYLVAGIAGWNHMQMDLRVLGFTLALTAASALLFGLAPALQAFKSDLNQPLKESGSRSSAGVRHRRLRSLLVIGEIALATALLAGAGIVLQSFLRVLRTNPGFEPDQLLTLRVMLPEYKYLSQANRQVFFDRLLSQVETTPGVASVSVIDNPPFWGGTMTTFSIEGRDEEVHGSPGVISPRYFETMRIPVLHGRAFTEQDTASSVPVAIIDEKLARQYWPNESPLGKRISFGYGESGTIWREIVGVVGEIKNLGLSSKPKEQYYRPLSQSSASSMCLMVRTKGSPTAMIAAVQKQISYIDPDQPITYVTTVRDQINGLLAPQKLPALLVAGFALLALVLAGVGLYGVVAYTTRQRTREFGIRLALGADRRQLIWLVLRHGMALVGIGLAIGLGSAFALGHALSRLIYEVHPGDFRIHLLTAAILALVALVACWLPARRAAKTDPMTALRYE